MGLIDDRRPYVIAEVASTHEGDEAYLLNLVEMSKKAGAHGIKFQIYQVDEILEKGHPDYDDLSSYVLSESQWGNIIRSSKKLGLDVWVDLSGEYGKKVISQNLAIVKGCKIHSSDMCNLSQINFLNDTNLSIILSCGGTTLAEIIETLNLLDKENRDIILMHGFQAYPTDLEDTHAMRIRMLSEYFSFPVGMADHIDGSDSFAMILPVLGVGMGARVIEKHITADREEKRDDYFSSLDPKSFASMVIFLEKSYKALGSAMFIFGEKEQLYRREMKKNVFVGVDTPAGETLRMENIKMVRAADQNIASSSTAHKSLSLPLKREMVKGEMVKDSFLEHKIGIFVNARLHSTRLPGKALLPLYGGYSTIEYLLNRLKNYSNLPGKIVFATSTDPQDDPLMTCAEKVGVDAFRGSPLDVMQRMLEVSMHFGFDTLVRVTGDDIFVSAEYIIKGLTYHFANNLEYTRMRGLGYGLESEIIDTHMLSLIHPHVKNKTSTEYLTWFLDRNGICRTDVMAADPRDCRENHRVTLDYEEDYRLMRDMAEACHPEVKGFYLPLDVINAYLDRTSLMVPHTDRFMKIRREDIDVSLAYSW